MGAYVLFLRIFLSTLFPYQQLVSRESALAPLRKVHFSTVQYSTVMKLVRNGRSFNVARGNFEKKAKKKTICEIKQDSLSFNAPLTSLPSNAFLQ